LFGAEAAGRKPASAHCLLDLTVGFPGGVGAVAEDFYFEVLASNS
jgi:hypothetical protein